VLSPENAAVSGYSFGVTAARTVMVTSPCAFVVAGIPAPPNPMRTDLPGSGVVPAVSRAVTEKLSPYSTVPGGCAVKASVVAVRGGAFGSVGPGIEPGR
jgi:hypothetical protein